MQSSKLKLLDEPLRLRHAQYWSHSAQTASCQVTASYSSIGQAIVPDRNTSCPVQYIISDSESNQTKPEVKSDLIRSEPKTNCDPCLMHT